LPLDGLVLRLPRASDVPAVAPAFADSELLEASNLTAFRPEDLVELLPQIGGLIASGRVAPLLVAEPRTGEILGGGALHHLDAERKIIEIGYWLFPRARGRGVATNVARSLAEHSCALGVQRVVAYVNVGNRDSERVLERAGFTPEGISRSMPKPDGRRIDKTVYSLLPGE
jgi:RimJ/RimL family protein N-acetyltransferase